MHVLIIYYLYYSKGYIPGRIEEGGIHVHVLLCLGIIDVLRKYKLKRSLQQGLKSVDDVSIECIFVIVVNYS